MGPCSVIPEMLISNKRTKTAQVNVAQALANLMHKLKKTDTKILIV